MPERRAEPEIDWDFSFVGERNDDRHTDPTPSHDGEIDWDFSFVDEDRADEDRRRNVAVRPASRRPHPDGDVDWDFSFVGQANPDGSGGSPSPRAGEHLPQWDFSFVSDESDPVLPSTAATPPADQRELGLDRPGLAPPRSAPMVADPRTGVAAAATLDGTGATGSSAVSDVGADRRDDLTAERAAEIAGAGSGHTRAARGPHDSDLSTSDAADHPVAPTDAPPTDGVDVVDAAPTDELERPSLLDDLGAEISTPAGVGGTALRPPAPQRGHVDAETTALHDQPFDSPPAPDAASAAPTDVTDATPVVPSFPPGGPVKVLTICTHNRTRSVMMMGLLQAGFDRAVGEGRVMVRSLGFGPEGQPPIADAVDEMADRGIDVSDHRSLQVTGPRVEPADLILTAEREHVAKIAEASPDAFRRTFTLPEFCRSIAHDPVPGNRSLREWLHSMSSARTPAEYLSTPVPEVEDPTGSPTSEFAAATATIESMCDTVVDLLEVSVGRPNWRHDTAEQG